jgi:hypothetical protein
MALFAPLRRQVPQRFAWILAIIFNERRSRKGKSLAHSSQRILFSTLFCLRRPLCRCSPFFFLSVPNASSSRPIVTLAPCLTPSNFSIPFSTKKAHPKMRPFPLPFTSWYLIPGTRLYTIVGWLFIGSCNPCATSRSLSSTVRVFPMASVTGIEMISVPLSATMHPKSPLWTMSIAPMP